MSAPYSRVSYFRYKYKVFFLLIAALIQISCPVALCQPEKRYEAWSGIEKQLERSTYQLNVGLKIKLKDGNFAYLIDLSSKDKLPVFGTMKIDKGFHIIGSGTAFAVKTKDKRATYFFTNKHVVESGIPLAQEAQRFFAALELYAEKVAGKQNTPAARNQILADVNLGHKLKRSLLEQSRYETTVNNIWQTYHRYLSSSQPLPKTDRKSSRKEKYIQLAGVQAEFAYFLHPHGPINMPAIQARLLQNQNNNADIALLQAAQANLPTLELANNTVQKGDEVIISGYPLAAARQDINSGKHYRISISHGKVKQVTPSIILLEASVEPGNSGSPVVSSQGKAIGMIVSKHSALDNNFPRNNRNPESKAIPANILKQTAPLIYP